MKFSNPRQLEPHRFRPTLGRRSHSSDPSVVTALVHDECDQRLQLAFYYLDPTQTASEHKLLEAVQSALGECSPELFDLPDYDYGPLVCFQWQTHFILDLTSQFS